MNKQTSIYLRPEKSTGFLSFDLRNSATAPLEKWLGGFLSFVSAIPGPVSIGVLNRKAHYIGDWLVSLLVLFLQLTSGPVDNFRTQPISMKSHHPSY